VPWALLKKEKKEKNTEHLTKVTLITSSLLRTSSPYKDSPKETTS